MHGVGIDICDVQRFDRLSQNKSLINRIFTEREVEYCVRKRYSSQYYAARFAAKEAFVKALGTGLREGIRLREIEVIRDELGKPLIKLHGKTKETAARHRINNILLSISHEKTTAVAVVIIEKEKSYE